MDDNLLEYQRRMQRAAATAPMTGAPPPMAPSASMLPPPPTSKPASPSQDMGGIPVLFPTMTGPGGAPYLANPMTLSEKEPAQEQAETEEEGWSEELKPDDYLGTAVVKEQLELFDRLGMRPGIDFEMRSRIMRFGNRGWMRVRYGVPIGRWSSLKTTASESLPFVGGATRAGIKKAFERELKGQPPSPAGWRSQLYERGYATTLEPPEGSLERRIQREMTRAHIGAHLAEKGLLLQAAEGLVRSLGYAAEIGLTSALVGSALVKLGANAPRLLKLGKIILESKDKLGIGARVLKAFSVAAIASPLQTSNLLNTYIDLLESDPERKRFKPGMRTMLVAIGANALSNLVESGAGELATGGARLLGRVVGKAGGKLAARLGKTRLGALMAKKFGDLRGALGKKFKPFMEALADHLRAHRGHNLTTRALERMQIGDFFEEIAEERIEDLLRFCARIDKTLHVPNLEELAVEALSIGALTHGAKIPAMSAAATEGLHAAVKAAAQQYWYKIKNEYEAGLKGEEPGLAAMYAGVPLDPKSLARSVGALVGLLDKMHTKLKKVAGRSDTELADEAMRKYSILPKEDKAIIDSAIEESGVGALAQKMGVDPTKLVRVFIRLAERGEKPTQEAAAIELGKELNTEIDKDTAKIVADASRGLWQKQQQKRESLDRKLNFSLTLQDRAEERGWNTGVERGIIFAGDFGFTGTGQDVEMRYLGVYPVGKVDRDVDEALRAIERTELGAHLSPKDTASLILEATIKAGGKSRMARASKVVDQMQRLTGNPNYGPADLAWDLQKARDLLQDHLDIRMDKYASVAPHKSKVYVPAPDVGLGRVREVTHFKPKWGFGTEDIPRIIGRQAAKEEPRPAQPQAQTGRSVKLGQEAALPPEARKRRIRIVRPPQELVEGLKEEIGEEELDVSEDGVRIGDFLLQWQEDDEGEQSGRLKFAGVYDVGVEVSGDPAEIIDAVQRAEDRLGLGEAPPETANIIATAIANIAGEGPEVFEREVDVNDVIQEIRRITGRKDYGPADLAWDIMRSWGSISRVIETTETPVRGRPKDASKVYVPAGANKYDNVTHLKLKRVTRVQKKAQAQEKLAAPVGRPEKLSRADVEKRLAALGYTESQMRRMRPAAKMRIIREAIPAERVSILQGGDIKVVGETERKPARVQPEAPPVPAEGEAAEEATGEGRAAGKPRAERRPAEIGEGLSKDTAAILTGMTGEIGGLWAADKESLKKAVEAVGKAVDASEGLPAEDEIVAGLEGGARDAAGALYRTYSEGVKAASGVLRKKLRNREVTEEQIANAARLALLYRGGRLTGAKKKRFAKSLGITNLDHAASLLQAATEAVDKAYKKAAESVAAQAGAMSPALADVLYKSQHADLARRLENAEMPDELMEWLERDAKELYTDSALKKDAPTRAASLAMSGPFTAERSTNRLTKDIREAAKSAGENDPTYLFFSGPKGEDFVGRVRAWAVGVANAAVRIVREKQGGLLKMLGIKGRLTDEQVHALADAILVGDSDNILKALRGTGIEVKPPAGFTGGGAAFAEDVARYVSREMRAALEREKARLAREIAESELDFGKVSQPRVEITTTRRRRAGGGKRTSGRRKGESPDQIARARNIVGQKMRQAKARQTSGTPTSGPASKPSAEGKSETEKEQSARQAAQNLEVQDHEHRISEDAAMAIAEQESAPESVGGTEEEETGKPGQPPSPPSPEAAEKTQEVKASDDAEAVAQEIISEGEAAQPSKRAEAPRARQQRRQEPKGEASKGRKPTQVPQAPETVETAAEVETPEQAQALEEEEERATELTEQQFTETQVERFAQSPASAEYVAEKGLTAQHVGIDPRGWLILKPSAIQKTEVTKDDVKALKNLGYDQDQIKQLKKVPGNVGIILQFGILASDGVRVWKNGTVVINPTEREHRAPVKQPPGGPPALLSPPTTTPPAGEAGPPPGEPIGPTPAYGSRVSHAVLRMRGETWWDATTEKNLAREIGRLFRDVGRVIADVITGDLSRQQAETTYNPKVHPTHNAALDAVLNRKHLFIPLPFAPRELYEAHKPVSQQRAGAEQKLPPPPKNLSYTAAYIGIMGIKHPKAVVYVSQSQRVSLSHLRSVLKTVQDARNARFKVDPQNHLLYIYDKNDNLLGTLRTEGWAQDGKFADRGVYDAYWPEGAEKAPPTEGLPTLSSARAQQAEKLAKALERKHGRNVARLLREVKRAAKRAAVVLGGTRTEKKMRANAIFGNAILVAGKILAADQSEYGFARAYTAALEAIARFVPDARDAVIFTKAQLARYIADYTLLGMDNLRNAINAEKTGKIKTLADLVTHLRTHKELYIRLPGRKHTVTIKRSINDAQMLRRFLTALMAHEKGLIRGKRAQAMLDSIRKDTEKLHRRFMDAVNAMVRRRVRTQVGKLLTAVGGLEKYGPGGAPVTISEDVRKYIEKVVGKYTKSAPSEDSVQSAEEALDDFLAIVEKVTGKRFDKEALIENVNELMKQIQGLDRDAAIEMFMAIPDLAKVVRALNVLRRARAKALSRMSLDELVDLHEELTHAVNAITSWEIEREKNENDLQEDFKKRLKANLDKFNSSVLRADSEGVDALLSRCKAGLRKVGDVARGVLSPDGIMQLLGSIAPQVKDLFDNAFHGIMDAKDASVEGLSEIITTLKAIGVKNPEGRIAALSRERVKFDLPFEVADRAENTYTRAALTKMQLIYLYNLFADPYAATQLKKLFESGEYVLVFPKGSLQRDTMTAVRPMGDQRDAYTQFVRTIQSIVQSDSELKALVKVFGKALDATRHPILMKAVRSVGGATMRPRWRANYCPIFRINIQNQIAMPVAEPLYERVMERRTLQELLGPRLMPARGGHSPFYIANALTAVQSAWYDATKYLYARPAIMRITRFLTDPEVAATLEKAFSKKSADNFRRQVLEGLALTYSYAGTPMIEVERAYGWFIDTFVRATIRAPHIAGVQAASLPLIFAHEYFKPSTLVKIFKPATLARITELMDWGKKHVPFIKRRAITPMGSIALLTRREVRGARGEGGPLSRLFHYCDLLPFAYIMRGIEIQMGVKWEQMSDTQRRTAICALRRIAADTQPMIDPFTLSSFVRTLRDRGPLSRVFVLFQSARAKMGEMLIRSILRFRYKPTLGNFARILHTAGCIAASSVMAQGVRQMGYATYRAVAAAVTYALWTAAAGAASGLGDDETAEELLKQRNIAAAALLERTREAIKRPIGMTTLLGALPYSSLLPTGGMTPFSETIRSISGALRATADFTEDGMFDKRGEPRSVKAYAAGRALEFGGLLVAMGFVNGALGAVVREVGRGLSAKWLQTREGKMALLAWVLGSAPKRRPGESAADYRERVLQWRDRVKKRGGFSELRKYAPTFADGRRLLEEYHMRTTGLRRAPSYVLPGGRPSALAQRAIRLKRIYKAYERKHRE